MNAIIFHLHISTGDTGAGEGNKAVKQVVINRNVYPQYHEVVVVTEDKSAYVALADNEKFVSAFKKLDNGGQK
jgi:hypothetical protein